MLNIFYVGVLPTPTTTRKEVDVKRLTTTLALGLILGFMLLVILPVQAQTTGSSGSNATAWGAENRGPSDRIARMLDSLGEKGYDVSAIMSALESGDTETARTLLHQFLQENQDALPMRPPAGDTPIPGISQYRNGNDPRGAFCQASARNTSISRPLQGTAGGKQARGGMKQTSSRTS